MICKYTLTVHCACPVDDGRDMYVAVCESPSLIPVETIIAAAKEFEAAKAFQEELTLSLARKLGCKVTTTGHHSGVLTEVTAP